MTQEDLGNCPKDSEPETTNYKRTEMDGVRKHLAVLLDHHHRRVPFLSPGAVLCAKSKRELPPQQQHYSISQSPTSVFGSVSTLGPSCELLGVCCVMAFITLIKNAIRTKPGEADQSGSNSHPLRIGWLRNGWSSVV